MMRYRMEPCGNNGSVAQYRVVDNTLSGLHTTVCEAPINEAMRITKALNQLEERDLEEYKLTGGRE